MARTPTELGPAPKAPVRKYTVIYNSTYSDDVNLDFLKGIDLDKVTLFTDKEYGYYDSVEFTLRFDLHEETNEEWQAVLDLYNAEVKAYNTKKNNKAKKAAAHLAAMKSRIKAKADEERLQKITDLTAKYEATTNVKEKAEILRQIATA